MREQTAKVFPQFKSQQYRYQKEKKCFKTLAHCSELNDRYYDYIWNSAYQKFGEIIVNKEEIRPLYLQKKLFLIDTTDYLVVDSLFHSYAFLTKDASILLHDISKSFQHKIKNTKLRGARIIVTSLLRTEKSVKRLMRRNQNSVKISSHLHGTTFDLAHDEFDFKDSLTPVQIDYLKDILTQTLYEYRNKERCFVTYETRQACFHVVNKK